ncbi:MAG: hypothetical protein BIFFINMI_00136 [Phycisphaerae bacterium]|nr:hypothetical protein [Phycisphaerae bacterium]
MLEAILFYGFAAMALAGAFGVLLSRNIVRTAVWLLATLGAAAGLYFLLGAMFVGAIQLIVYAGGTLVLIIFGVMLTSKNPHMRFAPRRAEVAVAAVVCLALVGLLVWVLLHSTWYVGPIVQTRAQWAQTGVNEHPWAHDLQAVTQFLDANHVAIVDAKGVPCGPVTLAGLARAAWYELTVMPQGDQGDRRQPLHDADGKPMSGDQLLAELHALPPQDRAIDDAALESAIAALESPDAPARTVQQVAYACGDADLLTDADGDGTRNIGLGFLGVYLLPFEVISVLLLAVLIGAAYLARPRVPASGGTGGGR